MKRSIREEMMSYEKNTTNLILGIVGDDTKLDQCRITYSDKWNCYLEVYEEGKGKVTEYKIFRNGRCPNGHTLTSVWLDKDLYLGHVEIFRDSENHMLNLSISQLCNCAIKYESIRNNSDLSLKNVDSFEVYWNDEYANFTEDEPMAIISLDGEDPIVATVKYAMAIIRTAKEYGWSEQGENWEIKHQLRDLISNSPETFVCNQEQPLQKKLISKQ